MKKLLLLPLFIIFLLSSSTLAFADATTISINPPVLEILIEPNKSLTQTFTLEHGSSENLMGTLELHRFTPADNLGHINLEREIANPSSLPLTITSSTHPLNQPFPLNGQSTQATFNIEAASSDKTEDVYLALVFKTTSADPSTLSSSAVPGITSLLLITITPSGSLPTNLDIMDLNLPVLHDSWKELTLTGQIKNNTNIMIRPKGSLEIISPYGKSLTNIPLAQNLILGNSQRAIFAETETDSAPLKWSPTWKNLGPHRFHLMITTQGGTLLSETEKVVWIMPIRLIIFLILVFLLLTTILLAFKRKNHQSPIDS